MKNTILLSGLLLVAGLPSQATINSVSATFSSPADLVPSVSTTDLLQTSLLSSSISGFDPVVAYAPTEPNGGGLFNGTYGSSSVAFGSAYIDNSTGSPWTAVFDLDLSAHPLGYQIERINVFSGWNSGLAGQDFTVELRLVGTEEYVALGRFTHAANNVAQVVSLTAASDAFLASGVEAIRFTHHTTAGDWRGSYREIDVIGVAVPEPAMAGLIIGFGVVGLAFALRRRRTPE